MKTNKKRKKKYTRIDGVLYEAITSNYDGRVIGWTTVQQQESVTNKTY